MDYFVYEPELRLLCCRICQTAVTQKQVKVHLRNSPHTLRSQEIREVEAWASGHDVFQNQQEAHIGLPSRPDNMPAVAALGPPGLGGFRCEFVAEDSTLPADCRYVGKDRRRIREHLRVKHGWDLGLKGGRRSTTTAEEERSNSPWRTGVYYQRLFKSGLGSELFEVARGLDPEQARPHEDEPHVRLQRAIEAFQSKGDDIRRGEVERIDEEDDVTAPNPWLRRLGSALHLKAFSGKKGLLQDLIAMKYDDSPDDPGTPGRSDDAQLRFVHMAFDRLVDHAKAVITPKTVTWNALFEVNRTELSKERSRPFHFRFKPETQRKYVLVAKQLLAYIVRCMSFDDEADRPPFKLSTRQQAAYDTMMNHADDLAEAWDKDGRGPDAPGVAGLLDVLEAAVLELYISVLDHFTKDSEYDSVLVSFLTVLSVRADGGWEGHGGFTPKLSAVMAISRLCIVKHAVDQRAKAVKQKVRQGQSQEEAEDNSPSHFALISEMTRRFMVGGGEGWETTPTQFVIRLRNFGMAIQNNTAAHGSVRWDGSREELLYKGTRLGVLDVQAMMRVGVRQLETVLYKDLLFFGAFSEQSPAALGLPAIPWAELLDNAADETVGRSLVDRLFQHDGGASRGWVIHKIAQDDGLRSGWVTSANDGGLTLYPKPAYRYGLRVEKALELLAVLVHISSGFPLRAWELLVVRHRNTCNGGIRNIFYDRGLIMVVTGAHKGFTTTGRLKIIHRFLPREVGTLLTYYLWLVLPFWEDVQANVWNRPRFDAGLWATEGTRGDETQPGGEQTGRDRAGGHDDDDGNDGWRLGPGEHWTSPRLSRSIGRLSALAFGQKLNISSWRHISTAMGRRYFRNASTAHTKLLREVDPDHSGSESESDDDDDDGDSPYDLQAGHGSKIAGLVYGRLVTEGGFETNERRVRFRQISEEWHRLLGFPSASGGFGEALVPGRKRKKASGHDGALRRLQLARWKLRRRVDIDRELVRLYGAGARFRGAQRPAIEAIMANKSPIVVVMGTGGGKSLSFMLPAASCPGGVTVVVVPLVSLQGDLMERCRRMRIPCAEWRSDRSPGPASLVFVTPESAMTKRFQDYVEGLRAGAQLDGFVIDEAHTILEGTRDFRPKLRELGRLALVGVQMVYLTATLPPSREAAFSELINARREEITTIRARTTRTNVTYSVQTVAAGTAGEEAAQGMTRRVRTLLDEKLETYAAPAKMIVYCRTVAATEALATALDCDAYHREVDSRDGKAERLRAWTSGLGRARYGGGRVIVATNALGLGIDVPDIRVVVHVEMPFEIADYAQQSGRAGRDGERSEAIVIRAAGGEGPARRFTGPGGGSGAEDFVGGGGCRRVVLDAVMDGRRDRDGCEEGEARCDVCQAAAEAGVDDEDSEAVEDDDEADVRGHEINVLWARGRARNRAMREAEEAEGFRERLQARLLGGCMFCGAAGSPGPVQARPDHMGLDCRTAGRGNGLARKAYETGLRMRAYFRRARGLETFGGCYDCFLPQELCSRWEEKAGEGGWRRTEGGGGCRYRGVMASTIAYVYTARPDEARELFFGLGLPGAAGDSTERGVREVDVWRWMGRRVRWGGLEASNMCKVFFHMADTDEDGGV